MEIQIFGRKSCQGTRKARRYFKERGASFHLRDVDQKGLAPRELDDLLRTVEADQLVDKNSKAYEARGLAYLETDLREEILEHAGILATPIVRSKAGWTVGIDEKEWKKHL